MTEFETKLRKKYEDLAKFLNENGISAEWYDEYLAFDDESSLIVVNDDSGKWKVVE